LERNELEKSLEKALVYLKQAVASSDECQHKAREALSQADRAAHQVELAKYLIEGIQKAIGDQET